MKVNGYHHVGLYSADTQRSLKFYTEGLGGKQIFSFPSDADDGKEIYLVDLGGGAVVEILPRGNSNEEQDAKWAHIALAVADAREACSEAVRAGAKVQIEPTDMMLGSMSVCLSFVMGPDGEVLELFQVK